MMRRMCLAGVSLMCCILLMGAYMPAPVEQSQNVYVNDYASLLFRGHSELFQEHSQLLEQETGVQLIVLTVNSLSGADIEDYAEAILNGWEIGGTGRNGALILAAKDEEQSTVCVGSGAQDTLGEFHGESIAVTEANYSKGIADVYRSMALKTYDRYTLTAPEALQAEVEEDSGSVFGKLPLIIIGLGLIIVLRSYRVSHKYRRRYNKHYVRRPKTYSRTTLDREEEHEEETYRIMHDGMD